jgi:hypothetical protein
VEYNAVNISALPLFTGVPVLLATIALNTTDNGCIAGMTFLDATVFKSGAPTACLTSRYSDFSSDIPTDDICAIGQMFEVTAETELGAPIDLWHYYVNYHDNGFPTCRYDGVSPDGEKVSRCVCILQNTEQNVVLKKDDNPLNGVTTFDLVLISKHILGLQQLPSGFNILAGDANMSNSLTTFDIVEIRKLILGIYSSFPLANSWRFIDKDIKTAIQGSYIPFSGIHTPKQPIPPNLQGGNQYAAIPYPYYFADEEFDEFALPPTVNQDSRAEFVGFKVGDVNNSAISNFGQPQVEDRTAGMLSLGTKAIEGRTSESVEIPVFGLGEQTLSGWQMALQYDTNLLKVKGVRWPAETPHGSMQDRGWHLARHGELRILWFDGEGTLTLKAGMPLFFVQAELQQNLPAARELLRLSSQNIPSEAYDIALRTYFLQLEVSDVALLPIPTQSETQKQVVYRLSVYPNPAGAAFRLQVETSDACLAQLSIRDALGREVFSRSLDLHEGMNTLPSAQLPALAPGHYVVSLYTPTGVEILRMVKQ